MQEGRKDNDGAEFVRVVDRAVARIQKLRGRIGRDERLQHVRLQLNAPHVATQKDALQKVRFDFAEAYGRDNGATFMAHIRCQPGDMRRSAAPILDGQSREVLPCEVLEFGSAREKKSKALGTGTKTG